MKTIADEIRTEVSKLTEKISGTPMENWDHQEIQIEAAQRLTTMVEKYPESEEEVMELARDGLIFTNKVLGLIAQEKIPETVLERIYFLEKDGLIRKARDAREAMLRSVGMEDEFHAHEARTLNLVAKYDKQLAGWLEQVSKKDKKDWQ